MNRKYWKNFKWPKPVFDITTGFSNQYGKELLGFIANKSVVDKKYANEFIAQFVFNCEIIMLKTLMIDFSIDIVILFVSLIVSNF